MKQDLTKEDLTKIGKAAFIRFFMLHKVAEPIVFSRFGNDPEKSLTIPANMRKAKMILRKIKQNQRLFEFCMKRVKTMEQ